MMIRPKIAYLLLHHFQDLIAFVDIYDFDMTHISGGTHSGVVNVA